MFHFNKFHAPCQPIYTFLLTEHLELLINLFLREADSFWDPFGIHSRLPFFFKDWAMHFQRTCMSLCRDCGGTFNPEIKVHQLYFIPTTLPRLLAKSKFG